MAKKIVDELIGRMATDTEFASQVHSDPDGALAAFDLTADERGELARLGADSGSEVVALGTRESKSSMFFMGAHQVGLEHGAQQAGLEHGAQQAGLDHGAQQAGLDHGVQQAGLDHGAQQAGLEPGSQQAGLEQGSQQSGI